MGGDDFFDDFDDFPAQKDSSLAAGTNGNKPATASSAKGRPQDEDPWGLGDMDISSAPKEASMGSQTKPSGGGMNLSSSTAKAKPAPQQVIPKAAAKAPAVKAVPLPANDDDDDFFKQFDM